jgi:hypothetical protein
MSSKAIEKIVFSGDFLRPCANAFVSSQRHNILWLSRLLGSQVALATGLTPRTVAWGAGASRDESLGDAEISAIYEELCVRKSIDGWAALYDHAGSSATLDAIVQRHFAGALVIGFELPPVVTRALLRRGAAIIDICVHPVRFLDDIFLAVRASEPLMRESLARHAVREEFLRLMAGISSAAALAKSSFSPEPNSLVIFDQTSDDAVRIAGGRFVRLNAFREQVTATAAAFARVYLKNHPYAPRSETLGTLQAWGIAAEEIDENAYCLMAHPNVRGVLSLSSSACAEAMYFDKEAHFLLRSPRRLALDGAIGDFESYVGIYDAFLGVDFWREVLQDFMPVTVRDGLKAAAKPNRLRLSLGAFWAYNRIDSDGYIAAAMQSGSALSRQASELASIMQSRLAQAGSELSRQAAELASMQSWLADETVYRQRSRLGRMLFRRDGRPTRGLRLALFHKNGEPRDIFRSWIIGEDGKPRRSLLQWMTCAEYLRLPKAYCKPSDQAK